MEGDILEVVSVKDEDMLGECWESPEEAMFLPILLCLPRRPWTLLC